MNGMAENLNQSAGSTYTRSKLSGVNLPSSTYASGTAGSVTSSRVIYDEKTGQPITAIDTYGGGRVEVSKIQDGQKTVIGSTRISPSRGIDASQISFKGMPETDVQQRQQAEQRAIDNAIAVPVFSANTLAAQRTSIPVGETYSQGYRDVYNKVSVYNKEYTPEISRTYQKEAAVGFRPEPKRVIDVASREVTPYEQRIYNLMEREQRLSDLDKLYGLEKDITKSSWAPTNVFRAVGRAGTGLASLPLVIGGRAALFGESLFYKSGRKEAASALRDVPAAVIKSYDVREPEGVINLVMTGVLLRSATLARPKAILKKAAEQYPEKITATPELVSTKQFVKQSALSMKTTPSGYVEQLGKPTSLVTRNVQIPTNRLFLESETGNLAGVVNRGMQTTVQQVKFGSRAYEVITKSPVGEVGTVTILSKGFKIYSGKIPANIVPALRFDEPSKPITEVQMKPGRGSLAQVEKVYTESRAPAVKVGKGKYAREVSAFQRTEARQDLFAGLKEPEATGFIKGFKATEQGVAPVYDNLNIRLPKIKFVKGYPERRQQIKTATKEGIYFEEPSVAVSRQISSIDQEITINIRKPAKTSWNVIPKIKDNFKKVKEAYRIKARTLKMAKLVESDAKSSLLKQQDYFAGRPMISTSMKLLKQRSAQARKLTKESKVISERWRTNVPGEKLSLIRRADYLSAKVSELNRPVYRKLPKQKTYQVVFKDREYFKINVKNPKDILKIDTPKQGQMIKKPSAEAKPIYQKIYRDGKYYKVNIKDPTDISLIESPKVEQVMRKAVNAPKQSFQKIYRDGKVQYVKVKPSKPGTPFRPKRRSTFEGGRAASGKEQLIELDTVQQGSLDVPVQDVASLRGLGDIRFNVPELATRPSLRMIPIAVDAGIRSMTETKPSVRESIRSKTSSDFRSRLSTDSILKTSPVSRQNILQNQKPISISEVRTDITQKNAVVQKINDITKVNEVQKIREIQEIRQTQIPRLDITTQTVPIVRTPTVSPPVIEPPRVIPPIPLSEGLVARRFGAGSSPAYEAYVKRKQLKKGKGSYLSRGYQKVPTGPTTREAALGAAMQVVDRYSNRSLLLKKIKGSAKPRPDLEAAYSRLKDKFTLSKRNRNVLTERARFAIDSPEEKKAIPYEAARLRKAGAFKSKKVKLW